jgi:hypothetical protein
MKCKYKIGNEMQNTESGMRNLEFGMKCKIGNILKIVKNAGLKWFLVP